MSLRDRLRDETRQSHDRVDARFGGYDIRARAGYAAFLQAHAAALGEMLHGIDPVDGADLRGETRAMLADLGRDLDRLGGALPQGAQRARRTPYRADAVRYVLLGSQIGMAHLRRRWEDEPQVRAARAFLSRKVDGRRWNDLRHRLSAIPAQSRGADAVVADARAIFDLYARHAAAHPGPQLERSR